MSSDLAIVRAAGVIMWHLRHGGTEEEAIARASAREQDLTDGDLRAALAFAQCHEQACLIASDTVKLLWKRKQALHNGEPDPYPSGIRVHTAAEILRAAGFEGVE